jgi:hypothetical protein
VLDERGGLELHADSTQQGGVPGPRAGSEERYRAAVGSSEPLDHLQRGGLAGAVGAEDPEALAVADLEADRVDDGPAVVALGESGHLDR